MSEVQAEFDKWIRRYHSFNKIVDRLNVLIAKGAKFTFKGTDYTFSWDYIIDRSDEAVIWYLDNVECTPELIDDMAKHITPNDGSIEYILRSKKCEFYIEKLMNHKDFDETIKANLQKLRTPFEVKTEDSSNVQMEFDALYSISHSDEKLIQNRSKLEELIAKGAKVKYCSTLLMDAIIAGTDPETAIWYLNHLDPCKDVIEDIVVICHEKFHPILEVVMRCNKCEYYLQKLAESDKVDAELRDNIKKLIKG